MGTSEKHSGWKKTAGQTYISGLNLGIEGLRIVKSATGCDIRLLGDTPATNYVLFDASAPSLAIAGSIAVTVASTLGVTGILTSSGGITMADAQNIVLNATTGTKIGTATTQKLGLYNTTPTAQQTHVADAPAGGTGATAGAYDSAANRDSMIATVNAILVRLETLGIVASA